MVTVGESIHEGQKVSGISSGIILASEGKLVLYVYHVLFNMFTLMI